eukprot:TRINITY_DN56398_c0_g1_i1.p1 TRINITY_DN56398_c0_g1~~TRINITY_DN56398_c0_g1_i1.p1  ORF type:complete len:667 (+),score=76.23 TRINITY_DN56398_c0_g1_i1:39-2039(+)
MEQLATEGRTHGRARTKQYSAKAQAANAKRLADAEKITELVVSSVPGSMTAHSLVTLLVNELFLKGHISVTEALANLQVGTSKDAYVMRCEIRPKPKHKHTVAFVTVRNREMAQALCDCPPIGAPEMSIDVALSNRAAIPPGSAWRTGSDPGSTRWDILSVQVGERSDEHTFCSFWKSPHSAAASSHAHVELSPVASVLAVTLRNKRVMFKGVKGKAKTKDAEPNDFVRTFGKLRIEISFRSFCDFPRAEVVEGSDDSYAICFPISRAPCLFRSCDESEGTPRMNNWDFLVGGEEEIRWIRTVDFSQNSAFSRAKALRITLTSNDMRSLFEKLHQLYLTESPEPTPVHVTSVEQKESLHRQKIFQTAANVFNISFSVRYAVARILSLGTVREAEIGLDFWQILSDTMTEDDALLVLEYMTYHLSSNEAHRRYNNPVEVLRNTMKLLNISDKNQRNRREAQSDEYTSETTEEFIMESYVDDLRLDELIADDPQSGLQQNVFAKDSTMQARPRQEVSIRRVICTPTRIIVLKAGIDMLNRVLREFSNHKHRFIRVSFCDEDGSSVAFAGSEDLFSRVRAALRKGIQVAGERFVFLAFSNSQLRDHSVWMYNETPSATSILPSAEDIRTWMGDFSKIRVPGKYVDCESEGLNEKRKDSFNDLKCVRWPL